MNKIYEALVKYLQDEKKVVEYLYVVYMLLDKYWLTIFDFVDQIKSVDEKLWELFVFFLEEWYEKKQIYDLLSYAIEKTWYNITNVIVGKWVNAKDFPLPNWDINVASKNDDSWIMIQTADWKIYKRFLLEDVKKMLNI